MANLPPDRTAYAFGPFRLQPTKRKLLEGEKPVVLGARAFDLLVALVEARGQTLSKDELISRVWPDCSVEENNLTVNISALRKRLRERPNDQRYVRTIPGRGYRFVATVELADDGQPAPILSAVSLPEKPSIAVLPFTNMSLDPAHAFFGDGIAEDIISSLSRNRWLSVIARNSSFIFKDVPLDVPGAAQTLGVRYILSGSVRTAGDQVRVAAYLMDAATNRQLVAERYDRTMADMFSLQDDITARIVEVVRPALLEAEQDRSVCKPPDSVDAWAAYHSALWHFSRFDEVANQEAQRWFERAIALDPQFAPGHHGLGLLMLHNGSTYVPGVVPDWQQRGEQLAATAIALDPKDCRGHSVLGLARAVRGDPVGAIAATEAALALNINEASAHGTRGATLMYNGRPEEGLQALATCIRLSPRDPRLRVRTAQVALGQFFAGLYEAAEATALDVVRRWPSFSVGPRILAMVLAETGRPAEARKQIEAAIALSPAPFDDFSHSRMPWFGLDAYRRVVSALRKAGWNGPA